MTFTAENIFFLGAVLIFASIVISKWGYRFGAPTLLLFLFTGMLFGSDGLGLEFNSHEDAQLIGMLSLSVILFSGGMDTKRRDIEPVASQGLMLSTVGVLITTVVTGLLIYYLSEWTRLDIGLTLPMSMLLAATVSSTDSASVFNLLRTQRIGLKHRLRPLLELDKAVITPLPAIMIATWDENKNPDVMMAAWGGQCGPKHITFELSKHKTTDNIRLKKAFTISFATKDDIVQSDYFGIVSGNDVPDKVKKAGFTITPSPNVDAPIINEYKLTLECKVVTFDEDENGGARVVGEIVNMSADESILDEQGNIDLAKLQPVIFDSAKNEYRVVGEKVGTAWGSGKAIQEREVK